MLISILCEKLKQISRSFLERVAISGTGLVWVDVFILHSLLFLSGEEGGGQDVEVLLCKIDPADFIDWMPSLPFNLLFKISPGPGSLIANT